jgi:hypothetical protein
MPFNSAPLPMNMILETHLSPILGLLLGYWRHIIRYRAFLYLELLAWQLAAIGEGFQVHI